MRISGEQMEKALVNSTIIVSADIETTGFSIHKGSEVIEISAIMIDTESKRILGQFNRFVKPRNGKIPAKITELTNITQDMVHDAPHIEQVLREFASFVGDQPMVFHKASFDWDRFMDPLLRKQGIIMDNLIIDTLTLTSVCLPQLSAKSLGKVCEHFGYSSDKFHRAVEDAKATGAIAIKYRSILMEKHAVVNQQETIESLKNANRKSVPPFKIKNINCWKKSKVRRIYLHTNWGNLFYDLGRGEWLVKNLSTDASVDFDQVQLGFLKAAGLDTVTQIESYFNENLKQQVS